MIWRANDSERDAEPFHGFGFGNQQKIPYFERSKEDNAVGSCGERKIGFTCLFKKRKQKKQGTKHTKERLKCENHRSINRAEDHINVQTIHAKQSPLNISRAVKPSDRSKELGGSAAPAD